MYQFTEEQFQHLHTTVQYALALLADYMQYENEDEESLEQDTYQKLSTAKDILSTVKQTTG
jgi:hypothetical protein